MVSVVHVGGGFAVQRLEDVTGRRICEILVLGEDVYHRAGDDEIRRLLVRFGCLLELCDGQHRHEEGRDHVHREKRLVSLQRFLLVDVYPGVGDEGIQPP